MKRYIALLRGINISGKNKVPMSELKKGFETLAFVEVKTYLNSGSEITVRITNNSGEEFSYGEYFSIQKQIDGQWYTVPVRADNVGFQDIAHILTNGESASETYNLNIYGTLEPGTYRLVVETLSAEFLVGHGRMAGIEGE